ATGYFLDQLNSYLSEWRAFSRKGFGLIFHRELRDQKGQTLVELMIAMSVMSIGFLGVFAVLSQSMGLNRVVSNQYIASNLAAEGIEVIKNIADSNTLQAGGVWNAGLGSGNFGVEHKSVLLNEDWANQNLKFDSNTGLYGYDAGTPTNFRRIVSITNISPAEISVSSTVRWRDRGGTEFEIVLQDRFFNWRSP
ncbi:MAG: prepilin-type N-terminal cleavage/methylation domain-containing protein, partial [bacterium]|nr:prepilin-type N-terminal cleavage/methylation domain-containing protein [bacterium]